MPDAARLLTAVLVLGLCGCATRLADAPPAGHTLANERRLPVREMAKHFTPAQWTKISHLEYVAFVIMDAQVRSDGSLGIVHVRVRQPDSSRDDLARALGGRARLSVVTVDSRIVPLATVFVVFFQTSLDGDLALIFAQQEGEPPPGMSRRATFLETTHY